MAREHDCNYDVSQLKHVARHCLSAKRITHWFGRAGDKVCLDLSQHFLSFVHLEVSML